MNIFVLDENPKTAAEMLCDCHVRKMCLETAQILSGVMLRRGIALREGMPKPQNINHPAIVTVDKSPSGLNWATIYNFRLLREFAVRFKKCHIYSSICLDYIEVLIHGSSMECSNFAKCCGNLDVSGLDIVTAYRKYYTEVKKPALQSKGLWNFTNRKDWTE